MKRKICIVTGTRADWGLLSPIAAELKRREDVELQIIATNMHLSARFGMTVDEIKADGFDIDSSVKIFDDDADVDSPLATAEAMGRCLKEIAPVFDRLKPDLIVVLGDRFEMLAVASAAAVMRIPIAHLHGGEITEGAIDNSIRNAITSLSSLHLTSTEAYRQRIIAMGEPADIVINTGSIGVYNALNRPLLDRGELQKALSFYIPKGTLLVTYHPATLDTMPVADQCRELLAALDRFPDNRLLITYPNNDTGGEEIIRQIRHYESMNPDRVRVIPSLGAQRYLSALQFVAAVVGNSSSGIIEVPSMGIPTVDIGPRQRGRIAANSVIHCNCDADAIAEAISEALSRGRRDNIENPYYKPDTLERIVNAIVSTPIESFTKCAVNL
ncbi:MAG: UDP-N-acetylglucosamine 2-epimerase (hydrolyzing) [Muribaculaceae bacterium]|nr:UDP-N-acetylglucosamine 2-epimerase (hydrolyzing) [Muribaculaceae bacterium]